MTVAIGESRTRRFIQYVGERRIDEARMAGRGVGRHGLAGFVRAADHEHSHFVELHRIRPDALSRFRKLLVPDADSGTGIFAEATFAGLDAVGEPRRGIGAVDRLVARRNESQRSWTVDAGPGGDLPRHPNGRAWRVGLQRSDIHAAATQGPRQSNRRRAG